MATKKKRHKFTKKQKKKLILEIVVLFLATVGAITILLGIGHKVVEVFSGRTAHKVVSQQPQLDVELLSINDYSRPGLAMNEVKGIVIHYTANPGSTAIQNRNYFEGLKDSHETMASSHFIVGLDGEIVQCIPTMRSVMLPMTETTTRFPLSVVTRMQQVSLISRLTIRLWS